MNTPISFELAKLLKEKGFPQLNQGVYYTKDKEHCLVGWGFNDRSETSFAQYSAPIIAEIVMWLYEKHEIWIYPKMSFKIINDESLDSFTPVIERRFEFEINNLGEFNSPKEAYESAINYILNNLI